MRTEIVILTTEYDDGLCVDIKHVQWRIRLPFSGYYKARYYAVRWLQDYYFKARVMVLMGGKKADTILPVMVEERKDAWMVYAINTDTVDKELIKIEEVKPMDNIWLT